MTRYPRHGATSRVRFEQFFPALARAGLDVVAVPLWDERSLDAFYAGRRRSARYVVDRYVRRFFDVFSFRRADVLWVEAELFPFLPPWLEEVLAARPARLVVDYDDAVYVKYQRHPLLRRVLGEKIERIMRCADVVIAGNEVLREHAEGAGAVRVVVIPTVVDLARYPVVAPPPDEPVRVGWIGTSHTAKYLDALKRPLQQLAQEHSVVFVCVGPTEERVVDLGVPMERHPWSEEREGALVSSMHIGVMPLPDEPWERGKCGYKLIQTMAAARPVVASPVGANVPIVDGCGRLAADDDAWLSALRELASSPSLRAQLGARGRQRVAERYELNVAAPLVVKALLG